MTLGPATLQGISGDSKDNEDIVSKIKIIDNDSCVTLRYEFLGLNILFISTYMSQVWKYIIIISVLYYWVFWWLTTGDFIVMHVVEIITHTILTSRFKINFVYEFYSLGAETLQVLVIYQ